MFSKRERPEVDDFEEENNFFFKEILLNVLGNNKIYALLSENEVDRPPQPLKMSPLIMQVFLFIN